MSANSLTDSFKDCAPWIVKPPEKPLAEDSSHIIFTEIHRQLFSCAWKLLYLDYGFKAELETGRIEVTGQMTEDEEAYLVDVDFTDKNLGTAQYMELSQKLLPYMNDFSKCIGKMEDIRIVQAEENSLMRVVYDDPEPLWIVLTKMVELLHPENTMAHAHLRTIPHLYERLAAGGPANKLC